MTEPPEVVHSLALQALRQLLKGDLEQARKSAYCLGIGKVTAHRLRRLLEDKVASSYASLLVGRVSVDIYSNTRPRQEWFNLMWLAWKKSKLLSPSCVATSADDSAAASQVAALKAYWEPIFSDDHGDIDSLGDLEEWVSRVDIGELALSTADFKSALLTAASTSPGLTTGLTVLTCRWLML